MQTYYVEPDLILSDCIGGKMLSYLLSVQRDRKGYSDYPEVIIRLLEAFYLSSLDESVRVCSPATDSLRVKEDMM